MSDNIQVPFNEIRSLAMKILLNQGHPEKHAELIYDAMLHAQIRGNSQVNFIHLLKKIFQFNLIVIYNLFFLF